MAMIRLLRFGGLCGATAAVVTFSAGGSVILSLAAYGLVGSGGLLIMAGICRERRHSSGKSAMYSPD